MRAFTSLVLGAALAVGGFYFAAPAHAADGKPPCKAPANLTDIEQPLPHMAARVIAGEPIKIVAIGSSSTAGAGATAPEASYPSRLAVELAAEFPKSRVTVVNRGVNGQESGEMLARLGNDVLEERPTLVIWQVGTNSVLRNNSLETVAQHIDAGIERIKSAGADVILVDPQYAPRVVAKPEAELLVSTIDSKGKKFKVGVFHRFAVMRHWREADAMPFEAFVDPDGLHHNDWSYSCWAKLMSAGIVQAVSRPTLSAKSVSSASQPVVSRIHPDW